MHKYLVPILLTSSLFAACAPSASHAWNATGHAIVCEIAYQELSVRARNEVNRLIELDPGYSNYAASCYYPDTVDDGRRAEHYVNFPRDTESVTHTNCPAARHCVFSAIHKELGTLRQAGVDEARLASIKYLGHWIGDLHQPLHVSFADDRGGNDISATGDCRGNLHSVWDGCIIKLRLLGKPTAENIIRYARQARKSITDQTRAEMIASDIRQWADESFQLATAPHTAYCQRMGTRCAFNAAARQITRPKNARRSVSVDKAYLRKHDPITRDRLLRAGVRLASVLNQAL